MLAGLVGGTIELVVALFEIASTGPTTETFVDAFTVAASVEVIEAVFVNVPACEAVASTVTVKGPVFVVTVPIFHVTVPFAPTIGWFVAVGLAPWERQLAAN